MIAEEEFGRIGSVVLLKNVMERRSERVVGFVEDTATALENPISGKFREPTHWPDDHRIRV